MSETFDYYVSETKRLTKELGKERNKVVDETINEIINLNVQKNALYNQLMMEGYTKAQKDIIRILKSLKNK